MAFHAMELMPYLGQDSRLKGKIHFDIWFRFGEFDSVSGLSANLHEQLWTSSKSGFDTWFWIPSLTVLCLKLFANFEILQLVSAQWS